MSEIDGIGQRTLKRDLEEEQVKMSREKLVEELWKRKVGWGEDLGDSSDYIRTPITASAYVHLRACLIIRLTYLPPLNPWYNGEPRPQPQSQP